MYADKDDSNSLDYLNSSSIQCAQKNPSNESRLKQGMNLNNTFSPSTETPELSSQSRIQGYNSNESNREAEDIDDFEVCPNYELL